jgi:hypothetical protein
MVRKPGFSTGNGAAQVDFRGERSFKWGKPNPAEIAAAVTFQMRSADERRLVVAAATNGEATREDGREILTLGRGHGGLGGLAFSGDGIGHKDD